MLYLLIVSLGFNCFLAWKVWEISRQYKLDMTSTIDYTRFRENLKKFTENKTNENNFNITSDDVCL